LHPIEILELESRNGEGMQSEYLASRWACKEALVKASGRRDLLFHQVYLKKDQLSKYFKENKKFGNSFLFKFYL
jgi:phosphopantetheinyl transferase (holo-ACP synthase)